jgi:hypothetical protein
MNWKAPVRTLLFGFLALSAAALLYRAGGPSAQGGTAPEPSSAREAPAPAERTGLKAAAAAVKGKAAKTAEARTAVVYYFYTDTRCSSCQTIEAYTREAVATRLAAGYKDWKVEFKGVNVDEAPNAHFVRDYRLDSKSVIVQKFSGGKAGNWGKLDKVWQLLGDKDAFVNYVADETRRLLDAE